MSSANTNTNSNTNSNPQVTLQLENTVIMSIAEYNKLMADRQATNARLAELLNSMTVVNNYSNQPMVKFNLKPWINNINTKFEDSEFSSEDWVLSDWPSDLQAMAWCYKPSEAKIARDKAAKEAAEAAEAAEPIETAEESTNDEPTQEELDEAEAQILDEILEEMANEAAVEEGYEKQIEHVQSGVDTFR